MGDYEHWALRMENFPHTADRMCAEYEQLFQNLLDQHKDIISKRAWVNQPWFKINAFLPRRSATLFLQKTKKVLKRWIG